jgi:hypothetical protein
LPHFLKACAYKSEPVARSAIQTKEIDYHAGHSVCVDAHDRFAGFHAGIADIHHCYCCRSGEEPTGWVHDQWRSDGCKKAIKKNEYLDPQTARRMIRPAGFSVLSRRANLECRFNAIAAGCSRSVS